MIIQPKKIESRRTDRVDAGTTAKFKNASGGKWYPVKLVNVSKSGACIYGFLGVAARQVGSFIELYLYDADGRDRLVVGEIVWSNTERAGVRFA